MAANPAFVATGNNSGCAVTAANTKSDGTGTIATDLFVAFTGGASGSLLKTLRFMPVASVAATAITATVMRVFVSTKTSGSTTAADTHCIGEVTIPSGVTADQTTTGINSYDFPVPAGLIIPSGSTVLVSSHVAPAANTTIHATAMGGDF